MSSPYNGESSKKYKKRIKQSKNQKKCIKKKRMRYLI